MDDPIATTIEKAKELAVKEFFGPAAEWVECDCDGEGCGECLLVPAIIDRLPGFDANGAGLDVFTFRVVVPQRYWPQPVHP